LFGLSNKRPASKWRDVPELKDVDHLSFREELHAIEAVIAGQGIGGPRKLDAPSPLDGEYSPSMRGMVFNGAHYFHPRLRRGLQPIEKVLQTFAAGKKLPPTFTVVQQCHFSFTDELKRQRHVAAAHVVNLNKIMTRRNLLNNFSGAKGLVLLVINQRESSH
jgi:hypothetical protein